MIRNLGGRNASFKENSVEYTVPGYWSIEVEKKRHFSLPGEPEISKGPKFSWKGSFLCFDNESTYNCLLKNQVNGIVVKDVKFYISENGYYVGNIYVTSSGMISDIRCNFVGTGELRYVEK